MKNVIYNGECFTFESTKEREERIKKVALDLFERCKSNNLTVSDFHQVLDALVKIMESNVVIQDRQDV